MPPPYLAEPMRWNVSKMRERHSAGTPGPRSRTAIRIPSAVRRATISTGALLPPYFSALSTRFSSN